MSIDDIAFKTLDLMAQYGITARETIMSAQYILAIQTTPDVRIVLEPDGAGLLDDVRKNDVVFIDTSGPNHGHKFVVAPLVDPGPPVVNRIRYLDPDAVADSVPTGVATVYRINVQIVRDAVESALATAEMWTGVSFSGAIAKKRIYSGNNGRALMIDWVDIQSITAVSINDSVLGPEEYENLDGTLYRKSGRTWPGGRQNITVEALVGYDEIPDEVARGLAYMAAGNLIQQDTSNSGDVTSFTVEGYSESGGKKGESITTQFSRSASAFLVKYGTGVRGTTT